HGVVPADRVLQIYEVTGVTPHELRPDLYPNTTDGLPKQEP
ncbi:Rha family transcriptional regulator, partial [Klebsiella pneumoniae]|nr:Rha family transcriptional regulator [Klebsiella pneumoniae]